MKNEELAIGDGRRPELKVCSACDRGREEMSRPLIVTQAVS